MAGIRYLNGATILPQHFDPALIGYRVEPLGEQFQARAIYSVDRILRILMTTEEMEPDEAIDWFYHNIEGSHLGPGTPIYIDEVEPVDE